ncbi:MAG: hypothetical protein H6581_26195 [Bacteroidia bacterium]|nr:hypothetical protein [Bacteroidia bacterium]
MYKRIAFLLMSACGIMLIASSCNQPIEFPTGVEVRINGESIEGDKVVLVNQGEEIRLQVTGLQSNSTVNFKVKKVGIVVYQDDLTVGAEGTVDEMIALPDIQVQVTAVVTFTDLYGETQEMSFSIKLR